MTTSTPIRLADVIGCKVIDAGGQTIGHVVDVVLDKQNGFCITAIQVGSIGWVDRLNIVGTIRRRRDVKGVPQIGWGEIASFALDRIILKEDAEITPPADHK